MAIYPKQLFIVSCPTFLFSKRVRSLVELWIHFNCGKCLAVKYSYSCRCVSGECSDRCCSSKGVVISSVVKSVIKMPCLV